MDRTQGARLLRQLRESHGWSWSEAARALRQTARDLSMTSLAECQVGSVQRNVARWESGAACPSDRYQFLLVHLYRSDLDTLLVAFTHFGVSDDRLRELCALLARVPSQPAETSPCELAVVVDHVNQRVGAVPFVRLQLELAPVIGAVRRLMRTPSDDVARVAATACSLAARLAFETRDDAAAMSLYAEAASAPGLVKDLHHRAAVRTSHTMVALHKGHVAQARDLALAAVSDAHKGSSCAIRARAHAVRAEICARTGQRRQAATALTRAWKTVDQLAAGDPHAAFNADHLEGFQGLCDLYVGDSADAHDRLARSVAAMNQPRDTVQRGINTSDLALARLRLGDPMACTDLLHTAVDITAATGGRVSGQRIRDVRRELRPWRSEPFVADLDDHIHDTLIGQ